MHNEVWGCVETLPGCVCTRLFGRNYWKLVKRKFKHGDVYSESEGI